MGAKWLEHSDFAGRRCGRFGSNHGRLGHALNAGTASLGADVADDPYVWLEDVHGEKQLAWVKERNEVALKQLKGDPDYQKNYDAILAVLDATDRIPFGHAYFSHVFNFWQDETHVRGIWRRTSDRVLRKPIAALGNACSTSMQLAADEGKNWVFSGASCAIDVTRCLVGLSHGGTDAVVYREFDRSRSNSSTAGSISAKPRPTPPISTTTPFCSAPISGRAR